MGETAPGQVQEGVFFCPKVWIYDSVPDDKAQWLPVHVYIKIIDMLKKTAHELEAQARSGDLDSKPQAILDGPDL